ncbi:scavenger receptor cysteine-rich domain-containing group B protein-like [Acropora muricata]|uniref:scavenger receptor cysteine-rich domain-containing group B protein-like n=1 Tax=Acropora muricata TaxID=159855 RepID=UPI0034E49ACA
MPNNVGESSHPCFTPPLMGKASDDEPSNWMMPFMPVWKDWIKLRSLGGHPILARTLKRPSQLTRSNALVRAIKGDDVAVSHVVRYIVFLPTLAKEFIQLVKQSAFATLDDFRWNPIHAWCFADGADERVVGVAVSSVVGASEQHILQVAWPCDDQVQLVAMFGAGMAPRHLVLCFGLEEGVVDAQFVKIDGGWSDWSKWSHCTKNVNGIQIRTRQCVNPKPQFSGKLCTGANATALRGCTNISRCRQDFSVRFLTIKGFPSNGSMQILSDFTWKDLCITNWNDAERNLVCQAQGYNGSSLGVYSNSGTNSSGNTSHSCEHLTQDCEEKISREIKCSVPVRLAGLDSINYAGRVEVFYQGKWGKICRNKWDINDVKVVCKQLGFQSVVAEFIGMDTKDKNISVVMSNVACTGQESVLASCKRFDGKHYCGDNKGAQAFCEPKNRTVLEKRHHVFNIGSTEIVNCSKIETKLGQKISWYNGATGVKIKSGRRIKWNDLSLQIKNFQLDDAGTYECRGISSTGFHTIYANAEFIHKIPEQEFISGGPGIIQCSALGNPSPHFKWSRQDRRSLQDGRFMQLTNGSLLIKSIQAQDKGTYICAIKQPRGSAPSIEKFQSINVMVVVDGGWSVWSQWSHCTKNISGIQVRIRRCVNPNPQSRGKPCPGPDVTVIRGCTNISRCRKEFRVSFRTTGGCPSTGSMRIFNYGAWKDLCVVNWDVVERNLVCQAQGYNGSSLGVHSKSGTNSLGNATYSCEQLTHNCEEKINTEIKCSGIKTFLSPHDQVEYFDAWPRNEDKDFKVVVRHGGHLLKELPFFLDVSLFTVPVRLAGVDGVNYAGRVEVFYQGKWGKICRDEWDIDDAKVVCRQLGFQTALAEFLGMDTKDEKISVAMSNVACTGEESVLASCKRRDGNHRCRNNIGAQAFCEPSKWKSANG